MKVYRCHTCGVKLVNDQNLAKHAGHQFRTPGNIAWYEYPKVWIWEVQEAWGNSWGIIVKAMLAWLKK